MNLETMVKDIQETKRLAELDIEAASWQTRPSLTNMKVEARERLEKLVTDYTKAIRGNSVGIFLFGDPKDVRKFAEIAAEEAGTFAVEADELYQNLAAAVEPSLGASREFGGLQLQGLIAALRQSCKDLNVLRMALPTMTDTPVVRDRQELLNQIKRLVRSAVGDDLGRVSLDHNVNAQAIASGFSGGTLPVVILNAEQDEVASYAVLFTNSISITVSTAEDGEVTKETVLKQFSGIKKKLKTKP